MNDPLDLEIPLNYIREYSLECKEALSRKPRIFNKNQNAIDLYRFCTIEEKSAVEFLSGENPSSEKCEFIRQEYFLLLYKLNNSIKYIDDFRKILLDKRITYLRSLKESIIFFNLGSIKKLAHKFSMYQIGIPIDEAMIINWLIKFGNEKNIRLAVKILESVEIVRDQELMDSFAKSYKMICEENGGRENVIVTQLVSVLESQPTTEHLLSKGLISEGIKLSPKEICNDLKKLLKDDKHLGKAILLVDDYIGSGTQLKDIFQELMDPDLSTEKYILKENRLDENECKKLHNYKIYICAHFVGAHSVNNLQEYFKEKKLNVTIINSSGRILQKCFENNITPAGTKLFHNEGDLKDAKNLCLKIGYELWSEYEDSIKQERDSLGYKNEQQLIVFSRTTPTNSLPILWREALYNGDKWEPLFPRPGNK